MKHQGYHFVAAWALLTLTWLAGCGRQPVNIDNPIGLSTGEYHDVFDAGVAVLRDYRFELNRRDRRFGVITTQPLTASSVIEPWYPDNTTSDQVLESTLNHDRRTVRLMIEPIDGGPMDRTATAGAAPTTPLAYQLRLEVLIERQHVPDQPLHTAVVGGLGFVRDTTTTHAYASERGSETAYWYPIGRDALLEQRLVRDILNQANLQRAAEQ